MQMAFIEFEWTQTTHGPTNSLSQFNSWVDAADPGLLGGTNWHTALKAARDLNFGDNDPTYVVFVSDGTPTNRDDRWGNVIGLSVGDPFDINFTVAKEVATEIVNSGKILYSVGAFGDVAEMRDLGGIYIDAANSNALNSAFANIANQIKNSFKIGKIIVRDEITDKTVMVSDFSYKKNDATWSGAPAASYADGVVTWSLGDNVRLGENESAEVSFTVYPKQEIVDLIADLNNLSNLDDAKKAAVLADCEANKSSIEKDGDKYLFKTNIDSETSPTLTYSIAKETSGTNGSSITYSNSKTVKIENPAGVDVVIGGLTLEKEWKDELARTQREQAGDSLKFDLYIDDEEYISDIELSKNNDWKLENALSLAPGMMVSSSSSSAYAGSSVKVDNYAILNAGHDYRFEEQETDEHYELTKYEYHPMLVDGVLKDVVFEKSGSTITGIESMTDMSVETVKVTNTVKGNLTVEKKVKNSAGEDVSVHDVFAIDVYLKKADLSGDYADNDCEYYVTYGENNPDYEAGGENKSSVVSCNGKISKNIYVGDAIHVDNVESGTLYYVEENDVPMGYDEDAISIDYAKNDYNDASTTSVADSVAKTQGGKDYYAIRGNVAAIATVTNVYSSGDLEISKELIVNCSGCAIAKAKEFEFTINLFTDNTKEERLTGSYNYVKSDQTDGVVEAGKTVKLKDGQTVTIKNLPEGAYYEVTEKAESGFEQSATGASGNIAKNETKKVAFTNTYSTSVDAKFEIKKRLVGRDWTNGEYFTINLTGEGIEKQAKAYKDTPALFEVELKDEKIYEFTITEKDEDLSGKGGVSMTGEPVTVRIITTDKGDGTLSYQTIYAGGAGEGEEDTILNTYKSSGKLRLGASKVLTGRDWADGETFTFTLFSEGSPYGEAKIASKATPDMLFDEISYTNDQLGQTFIYVIRETSTIPGGITPSGDITATVELVDNGDGTITPVVTYTGGTGDNHNVFVNTYNATGNLVLDAIVELIGRDEWLDGERYNLVLRNKDGQVVGTVPVDASGAYQFEAIPLTLVDVGEHEFTITEEGDFFEGIEVLNDIDVTVNVKDNGQGGLLFDISYTNNDTITNRYKANPVSYGCAECNEAFNASKMLVGRDLVEGEFEFDVYLDGVLVATGYNLADGTIVFDGEFEFTEAGEYEFIVVENTDNRQEYVSYDESEHSFVIRVVDDGTGKLKIESDDSDEILFINYYAEPGHGGNGDDGVASPRTEDDIMPNVAVFVLSFIGLLGSAILIKRSLKSKK